APQFYYIAEPIRTADYNSAWDAYALRSTQRENRCRQIQNSKTYEQNHCRRNGKYPAIPGANLSVNNDLSDILPQRHCRPAGNGNRADWITDKIDRYHP